MSQSITITDHDYSLWVKQLSKRFRQSKIQSAVRVNQEMLRYYWELGRDIVALNAENKYGRGFYANLSRDLRQSIPEVTCFSETSIRYAKRFFELYNQLLANLPQLGENLANADTAHTQQMTQKLETDLFSIPWGHHKYIIDKCSDDPNKALFYVQQTLQNGWSRSMLLNFMGTDLYERQGKAMQ